MAELTLKCGMDSETAYLPNECVRWIGEINDVVCDTDTWRGGRRD